MDDNYTTEESPKPKLLEPEKEKRPAMQANLEKPEAKVKQKSSYKKLISNLQTTYPDLSQEDALKGILALRVQNNGTLTGMTMLEIMERVVEFAKSDKEKQSEGSQSRLSSKVKLLDSEKENSKPDIGNKSVTTNGENSFGPSSHRSEEVVEQRYGSKTPKSQAKRKKQFVESDDEEEEKIPVSNSHSKWSREKPDSEDEDDVRSKYVSNFSKSQSKRNFKKVDSDEEEGMDQKFSYKNSIKLANRNSSKTQSDDENDQQYITKTQKFQTNGNEKAHVTKSKAKWNENGDNSEHEEELEPVYISHTPKSQSKKHMKKIESFEEDEVEQDNSYKTPKSQAKLYYKTHSDDENDEKNITRTPKSQSKRIIMKKAESEEDEYDGDKNKSKSKTPKSHLKKNKLHIEKDIGRQESDEVIFYLNPKI